jgi:hypothetical protein
VEADEELVLLSRAMEVVMDGTYKDDDDDDDVVEEATEDALVVAVAAATFLAAATAAWSSCQLMCLIVFLDCRHRPDC